MAYATIQDLIDRYGATELIRLTTPADQELGGVVREVADVKLEAASALIDSYVGRRYRTPMDLAPPVIVDACCTLTRYTLATGEQKTASEQMMRDRKETMDWLRDIALGKVVLELDEVATGDESYAQVSTREPTFRQRAGWV